MPSSHPDISRYPSTECGSREPDPEKAPEKVRASFDMIVSWVAPNFRPIG